MPDDPNKDENDETPRGFEEHLLVYVRDASLWPVLTVVVLIAGTLGASVIIYALELRDLFALAAISLLLVMSGHALWGDIRARRLGAASWITATLWGASLGIAALARMIGVF